MTKRIISLILTIAVLLTLAGCAETKTDTGSTFSITFIDVGQGDSALVECDGHYMLIDGGDANAGDRVYNVLKDRGVRKLDILAISHLHTDHIGGLAKALTYAASVDKTISNSADGSSETFRRLEEQLIICGTSITVPRVGEKFELGSARIEVVDCANDEGNDSLVLLITYGQTSFLFTGDIEEAAQTRICDRYSDGDIMPVGVTLMKLPHHGSYTGTLYRLLWTYMPENIVISVGSDNTYGHPHNKTLELLESKTYTPNLYRTDLNGNITVKSDGERITVETER